MNRNKMEQYLRGFKTDRQNLIILLVSSKLTTSEQHI